MTPLIYLICGSALPQHLNMQEQFTLGCLEVILRGSSLKEEGLHCSATFRNSKNKFQECFVHKTCYEVFQTTIKVIKYRPEG